MLQVESKIGKIERNQEEIYELLSDFNKASKLFPPDKLQGAIIEQDRVVVTHPEAGKIEFSILQKEPPSLIKYSGNLQNNYNFFLWMQLKSLTELDTRFKITIKLEVPSMIGWALKSKLKNMLDEMVDRIEKM